MNFIGCGIPLYFEFLKFGIFFLTFITILVGIYAMYFNSKGEACVKYSTSVSTGSADFACENNMFNTFAESNTYD